MTGWRGDIKAPPPHTNRRDCGPHRPHRQARDAGPHPDQSLPCCPPSTAGPRQWGLPAPPGPSCSLCTPQLILHPPPRLVLHPWAPTMNLISTSAWGLSCTPKSHIPPSSSNPPSPLSHPWALHDPLGLPEAPIPPKHTLSPSLPALGGSPAPPHAPIPPSPITLFTPGLPLHPRALPEPPSFPTSPHSPSLRGLPHAPAVPSPPGVVDTSRCPPARGRHWGQAAAGGSSGRGGGSFTNVSPAVGSN